MSEELLIRQAAPTLAGLKTGNLFSSEAASWTDACRDVKAVNDVLREKGLRLLPLRWRRGRVLLYLYRPDRLREDLSNEDALSLLRELGYRDLRLDSCLRELRRRLCGDGDFPHEIGLFLSYPPEDVRGFISSRGQGSKCLGCWQVYGNEEKATALFRAFRVCTENYCMRHAMGESLFQLAVAK